MAVGTTIEETPSGGVDTVRSRCYLGQVQKEAPMPEYEENEEYVSRCVVDPCRKTINLYSNLGSYKTIECDTLDQFMNVLSYIRDVDEEDLLGGEVIYVDPTFA